MPGTRKNLQRLPARSGLTLIECMIASTLLAIGASAAMVAVSAGYQHQRVAQEQAASVELARQLLEEVVARPFFTGPLPIDIQPPAGSAQEMDGYADVRGPGGVTITDPGVVGFSRSVAVRAASDAGLSLPGHIGVAVVEVTAPSGQKTILRQILRSDSAGSSGG